MRLRRLRDNDVLEGDISLVRGGELDPDILRADAQRYHDVYATYGISVFAVRGLSLEEMAQQVPLVRFHRMTIITARETRRVRAPLRAHRAESASLYGRL